MGICGGFQMLGRQVTDPLGVEGGIACLPGLGLLPVETTMRAEKKTEQVEFLFHGELCRGYEIHQGVSTAEDAVVEAERCMGTYVHGILDNRAVIDWLLAGKTKDAAPDVSAEDFKEQQYERLAAEVRACVDMKMIYDFL